MIPIWPKIVQYSQNLTQNGIEIWDKNRLAAFYEVRGYLFFFLGLSSISVWVCIAVLVDVVDNATLSARYFLFQSRFSIVSTLVDHLLLQHVRRGRQRVDRLAWDDEDRALHLPDDRAQGRRVLRDPWGARCLHLQADGREQRWQGKINFIPDICLFLHNSTLRPINFTPESAKNCDKSCHATKL